VEIPTNMIAIRTHVQRLHEIENEWKQANNEGHDVLTSLIQLTIEQQYMSSPFWGVFTENENLKQRVAQKISHQVVDSIISLQILLESRMQKSCMEINQVIDQTEKLRQDFINNSQSENEDTIRIFSVYTRVITEMKRIRAAFKHDLTVKNLLVEELQEMVAQSKYGEEYDEKQVDENDDDAEENEMAVISHTTLQFYAQTWKLQAHVDRISSCWKNLKSIILNEIVT
jgi:hypothetical protein